MYISVDHSRFKVTAKAVDDYISSVDSNMARANLKSLRFLISGKERIKSISIRSGIKYMIRIPLIKR